MEMVRTALGRWALPTEKQLQRQDAILAFLFAYRFSPQNPDNAPMDIGMIANFLGISVNDTRDDLAGLVVGQAFVEIADPEGLPQTQFAITMDGARFVQLHRAALLGDY